MNPKSFQRGIGLTELAIVMAVAAVLASTAAPAFQTLLDNRRLDGTATQLATDIQFVRTLAVARNEPIRISFYPASSAACYVVHTGAAGQCACGSNGGPAQCTGAARPLKTVALSTADRVAVQANVASILFDPLHGTSSPTGTLRVVGASGRSVQHVVNVMGRLRSCSPDAAVPGYRAC